MILARFKYFDWILMGALATLALASLVTLASSGGSFFMRQLVWYSIGFGIIGAAAVIDWRWLGSRWWFRYGLYWTSVALVLFSNFQSGTIRGTKSWIVIGSFQFEPAELVKLALIFILATFFSKRHVAAWEGKNIARSLLLTAIPVGLIVIHPDFGSAFAVFMLWVGMFLVGGIHVRRFTIGIFITALIAIVAWTSFLKPYQRDRITAFVFPDRDPLGINYNVNQSKIAIGSAGFWGKGFGGGTQAQLRFLPEAQTDFLFAAFVEEWGVVGGFVLFGALGTVVWRVIAIGLRARENYSRFLTIGAATFFLIHFFINVGSNLGLLPVAGITFPFFSYGGSSLLTSATVMSTIQRIRLESST